MTRSRRRPRCDEHTAPAAGAFAALQRHGRWAVMAVGLALAAVLFDPKPFVGGDNATYLLLARAIRTGAGYVELWTAGNPPHTLYPPGYPVLLAAATWSGAEVFSAKAVSLACWLAGLWLFMGMIRRFGGVGPAAALLIGAMVACNPLLLEYAHWELSEMPFFAVTTLTLHCASRAAADPRRFPPLLLLSVALAMAGFYIRPTGLVLAGSLVIALLWQRRIAAAAAAAGLALLLWLPWQVRNMAAGGGEGLRVAAFAMRNPYDPAAGTIALSDLIVRLAANARIYFLDVLPVMVFPPAEASALAVIRPAMGVLAVAAAAVGVWQAARRQPLRPWALFLVGYFALALVWPEVWSDSRFLLPVAALTVFFIALGLSQVRRWLRTGGWSRRAMLAAYGAVLLSLIATDIKSGAENLAMLGEYRRGDRLAGHPPGWRGFFQAAEWVARATPPQATVVSRKPSLFYLESGRTAYCYPFTVDRDSVVRAIVRADYVMVEPVSGTVQRYLIPAVEPHIGTKFRIVHAAGNPPTYVLHVVKENSDANGK